MVQLFQVNFINCFCFQNFYYQITFEKLMSSRLISSKINQSRQKSLNNSSVVILHKGIKRKISQGEYKKVYPKMKSIARNKTTLTLKDSMPNEDILYEEINNFKKSNRFLKQNNDQLKVKIKKMKKVEQIYEKKLQQIDLNNINYDKLLEFKLLLQSEQLQEDLMVKQNIIQEKLKKTKRKRQDLKQYSIEPHMQLYSIIYDDQSTMNSFIELKQEEMEKQKEKIDTFHQQVSQLRHKAKNLKQEVKLVGNLIKNQSLKLPNGSQVNNCIDNNDSTVAGTLSLSRHRVGIEDLEKQIVKIREQCNTYEDKIQKELDQKVKEKLLLMKNIDKLKQDLKNYSKVQRTKKQKILY